MLLEGQGFGAIAAANKLPHQAAVRARSAAREGGDVKSAQADGGDAPPRLEAETPGAGGGECPMAEESSAATATLLQVTVRLAGGGGRCVDGCHGSTRVEAALLRAGIVPG
eukprot:CAMPEP_0172160904 /NCGR_PEP_ID=MMETSP1050-20130122/5822_1 /TAXON_ID=233186 /ORGANISM="Cryptomonas curvata, Strain CCAP979/52" /LENGTH=110 /DNA_ID=CAMNT_0012830729 /DNA_START=123 /DNA_END=452 /DNA_ORIENTATION=+